MLMNSLDKLLRHFFAVSWLCLLAFTGVVAVTWLFFHIPIPNVSRETALALISAQGLVTAAASAIATGYLVARFYGKAASAVAVLVALPTMLYALRALQAEASVVNVVAFLPFAAIGPILVAASALFARRPPRQLGRLGKAHDWLHGKNHGAAENASEGERSMIPMPERPWASIWFAPGKTLRAILDSGSRRSVLSLAVAWGIWKAFDWASLRQLGDGREFEVVVLMALGLGVTAGLLMFGVLTVLLSWIGRLFGGRASTDEAAIAFGWAAVPAIAMLFWLIPGLFVFGPDFFRSETPLIDNHIILFLLWTAVYVALALWNLVILCAAVAVVHGISYAKALLVLVLLPGGFVVVALPAIYFQRLFGIG
jgi:hypothetical protein